MTRINLVHPSELSRQHLLAETHEITRVFALARKAQHGMYHVKQPEVYTLGTGHVKYFYNRLGFITERYSMLCDELRARGYNCNQIPKEELHRGIESNMFWGYNPTEAALAINRERIKERS